MGETTASLDNALIVATPEGVDLELQVAGPLVRGVALLIDGLIKLVLQLSLYFPLTWLGYSGAGVFMLLLFLLEWFYPVLFEVLRRGQTPGKVVMGIHVIHDDGTPISWSASMLRNLIRFVDLLPFGYQIGCSVMLLTRDFRRLGDLVAGSLVVYQQQQSIQSAKSPLPNYDEFDHGRTNPIQIPLSREEQLAMVNFAERETSLSKQRGFELANILSGLVKGKDEQAVLQLRKEARRVRGE